MFVSTSFDSGDGKSDAVSTSWTKWKGKKTATHLDFHMLCSQEANIIPWMFVIKQCDMDNCYALSLFRQVFFLLNKPLKGLKYNRSQLSAHKLFPSHLSFEQTLQFVPVNTPVWFSGHWKGTECDEMIRHSGDVEKLNLTRVLGAWPGRGLQRDVPKRQEPDCKRPYTLWYWLHLWASGSLCSNVMILF